MDSSSQRAPLVLIAVGLGGAGVAKLASTRFTVENFARWGYPEPSRHVIGAIEVGVAAAVAALRSPGARPVAAVGTLCSMAGALATHLRAHDSAPNLIPPSLLAAAAVRVLAGD